MRSTLVIGAITAAVLSGFPAASAAASARYLGFEGSETAPTVRPVSAQVRVNGTRDELIGASYVRIAVGCGRTKKIALAGTSVHHGNFTKAQRRGDIRYRLRGHFVTRAYATFRYSASSPARASASARCQSGARTGALYANGVPPFSGCRSQPAKTDVQNGDGRSFEQLRFVADDSEFVPFAYACLFSADKRVPLSPIGESMELTLPRVVAPLVAFAVANCPGASCYSTVTVRNLQDGRVVSDVPATMTGGAPGDGEHVTDIELKPNGSLAWLVQLTGAARRTVEVVAVDVNGRRLLESSPDIDPQSLALDGSTLSWSTGGVTHSATLD
jgi:hypothetical protein